MNSLAPHDRVKKGCWRREGGKEGCEEQEDTTAKPNGLLTIKSCMASARSLGSLAKEAFKKSLSSSEYLCSFFKAGRPFVMIKKRAFAEGRSMYGGSPSSISLTMMPRLQISTL